MIFQCYIMYIAFSIFLHFLFFLARGHSRKTYGRDFPQKERDTAYHAPLHTDQHGTSWRSDVPPPCLGGASHRWVPVNTHGTPVLISVRRPWVAQPRPRAQHKL